MRSRSGLLGCVGLVCAAMFLTSGAAQSLDEGWSNPPNSARLRAYWWWLNGNVTKEAITRDLEQMKAKGFGGALICDADGSSQDGNQRAPHGPTFFSAEWRELYKHTLREADRLGLEMSLNIQSGWNLGGPMVTAEDAPKKLVWTERQVKAGETPVKLAAPKGKDRFYRDLFVLAYPVRTNQPPAAPLKNQKEKALIMALRPSSAPDSSPLFEELPSKAGEEDTRLGDVEDLTSSLQRDGTLDWSPKSGTWQVIRFGYTLNDHCKVSTCSQGWEGYALDPFDAGAFKRYWDAVVEPLIADAGPLAGTTLKYLHTDSWEVEVANWTPTLRGEFSKRRGYDCLGWLPVIAGKIVNSREESDRFLNDFRRTMGDLAIDNHYRLFKEGAHRHGMLIHPESGGPHAVPIDAQQCLGYDDAPMSEFWAWSWTHRVGDENRFFVKQPASASHVEGRNLVLAEGFTTIGPHWQETLWDNLKPAFDFACTEGLNRLVWHAFVCSPESQGIPGQQYFAGTHLNPLVTWWDKSAPFFQYLNRCQFMLQQGLFVADAAYYYGDHVPNFAQLRRSDPARLGAGYDYDVIPASALLERATARNGRLVLPDGMSYRVLVLPERTAISLPVLRKIDQLVRDGVTVIGPRPTSSTTLLHYPESDREVQQLANGLWGPNTKSEVVRKSGNGRVIHGLTARQVLEKDGVKPDFECSSASAVPIQYIHRHTEEAEIYFVANRSNVAAEASCTFRVRGLAPELWSPVTGKRRAAAFKRAGDCTKVQLQFDPCGSWFVVFKQPSKDTRTVATPKWKPLGEITGPWTVSFDPKWGGPGAVQFDKLGNWADRSEPGIKFYSGTAIYRNTFDAPAKKPGALWIDLGEVRELAEVRVNGESCGIVWAPPFRVDVTRALKPGQNEIQIEVVNFWPNRIIGDAGAPPNQRFTKTNIRKLTADTPLIKSGLMGPVRLLAP